MLEGGVDQTLPGLHLGDVVVVVVVVVIVVGAVVVAALAASLSWS